MFIYCVFLLCYCGSGFDKTEYFLKYSCECFDLKGYMQEFEFNFYVL